MRKTPPFMRSFHFVFIIALIISVLIRCGFAAGSPGAAPISADLTETSASLPIRAPLCKLRKTRQPRRPVFERSHLIMQKKHGTPPLLQHFASSPFLEGHGRTRTVRPEKTSVLGLNNVDFGDTINIGYNVTLQSSPFQKIFWTRNVFMPKTFSRGRSCRDNKGICKALRS